MISLKDTCEWYQKNIHDASMFKVDDTVQCWQVSRNEDWRNLPFHKQFLVKRVHGIRKSVSASKAHKDVCPAGVYVVSGYMTNWLLVIYTMPCHRNDGRRFQIRTADHISMSYERKKIKMRHMRYLPVWETGDGEDGCGCVSERKNLLKEPQDGSFDEVREYYRDLVRHVLLPPTSASGSNPVKKETPEKHVNVYTEVDVDAELVCNRWRQYKIHHFMIFAKKHGDMYHCTCIMYDYVHRSKNEARDGFAFMVPEVTQHVLRERVLKHVAALLNVE
jgi:hypothetical protein